MTNISVLILTVCMLLDGYVQALNLYDAIIHPFEVPDERASCPQQVNCAGKAQNCSSDSNCPESHECCIDKVLGFACCIDPAIIPPATPAIIADTTPLPISICSGLTSPCPPADGPNGINECECSSGADCYDNEICCIDISKPPLQSLCYLEDPQPTPGTTPEPGKPCPASVLSLPCQRPGIADGDSGKFCDLRDDPNAAKCGPGQICCTKDRYSSACCMEYP